jgi:hypothetical protein
MKRQATTFRTVAHGTCALRGEHNDPEIAAACPVLRAKARAAEAKASGDQAAV